MSTISIKMTNAFTATSTTAVTSTDTAPVNSFISISPPLQDHEKIWVWDHYFSYVLHHLSQNEAAELLDIAAKWAIDFTPQMTRTFADLSNSPLFEILPDCHLVAKLDHPQQEMLIEATSQSGQWPNVHIRLDKQATLEGLQYSVVALAQFFLTTHAAFYRELPLHILAMRKYYQSQLSYEAKDSIMQAPAFALSMAEKFQQQLLQTHSTTQPTNQ